MRSAHVEAFQYRSARDLNQGINVGLFTPNAFQSKMPTSFDRWICTITHDVIGFISHHHNTRLSFDKESFCVEGQIPAPAC
jgi:hypothetical protein